MINRKVFFDQYKKNLDPSRSLDAKEVSAIDEFIDYVDANIAKLQWNNIKKILIIKIILMKYSQ